MYSKNTPAEINFKLNSKPSNYSSCTNFVRRFVQPVTVSSEPNLVSHRCLLAHRARFLLICAIFWHTSFLIGIDYNLPRQGEPMIGNQFVSADNHFGLIDYQPNDSLMIGVNNKYTVGFPVSCSASVCQEKRQPSYWTGFRCRI